MFKKFMSLTLALVMALGLFAGAVDYKDASDIADYAKDAVQTVYNLNLMQGDNNGNFKPTDPITREQMMRVMYSLYEAGLMTAPEAYKTYLTNSNIADAGEVATWARANAGYAVVNGIFMGDKADGTGKLNPKGNITYQQMSVILLIALGYDRTYIQTHTGNPGWGENAILLALRAGLLNDLPGNTVYTASASRQDVAVMLANALKAKTVPFNTTSGKYVQGNALVEANFGLENVAAAVKSGVVVAYGDKTYTVAKATKTDAGVLKFDNTAGALTYTVASGEKVNPALVGEIVNWTVRGDGSRINNIATVATGKRIDNVKLADITFDGTKVKVNGAEFVKDVTLFYSAGNGKNDVNYLANLAALKTLVETKAPIKVSVVTYTFDGKTVVGIIGMYNADMHGFGKITKIDKGIVTVGDEYVAASVDGLAKDDYVYFVKDASLDKDGKSGAAFTKVTSVAVKDDKFATKTVIGTPTYYIDGGVVVNASKSLLSAADSLFFGTGTLTSKATYNVYAIDGYVYNIVLQSADTPAAKTYGYGQFVSSKFTTAGATVSLLTADGKVTEFAVSHVGTTKVTPIADGIDPVTLQPIYVVDQLKSTAVYSFVSYELVDGKYIVYPGSLKLNAGATAKSAKDLTIDKSALTIGSDKYNKDTVFFVRYKDADNEGKYTAKVLKGSDVNTQVGKDGAASYVDGVYAVAPVIEGASVSVASVVYLDLSNTALDKVTLFTVEAKADTSKMLLTADPAVITQAGKTTIELTGYVAGELKTVKAEVNGMKYAVAKGELVTVEVKDGKLNADVKIVTFGEGEDEVDAAFSDINEYLSAYPTSITLASGSKTVSDKVKVYYLDKDGALTTAYSYEIASGTTTKTHKALIVSVDGEKITEMYVQAKS